MTDQIIGQIFLESAGESDIRSIKRKGSIVEMVVVLQDADNQNRNGRIYPKNVIQEGLKHPFILEKLSTQSLAGEMNHPDPALGMGRQLKIDLKNVSHFVKEIWWDTKNPKLLMGRVETAANSVGKDLTGMILENKMISSFSMRGAGPVAKRNGVDIVKGPLRIITWDNVHYPSHPLAYQQSLAEAVNTMDVTKNDLAMYIASNSENTQILTESISPFITDLSYSIENNKVVLRNKETSKVEAIALVEENLRLEYEDALFSFLK